MADRWTKREVKSVDSETEDYNYTTVDIVEAVTPDCCVLMLETGLITIYQETVELGEGPNENPPFWLGKGSYPHPVCFCPFCGVKLPEIRLRPDTENLKINSNHYDYCQTCGERNMKCCCHTYSMRWTT